MDIKRAELKNRAKNILTIKYWPLFVMALVPYIGSAAAVLFGIGVFFEILFVAPFKVAYTKILIDNSEKEELTGYRELLTFFRENYSDLLKNTFFRDILLMLWKIPLIFGIFLAFIGIYSIIGIELIRGGGIILGELTDIDFQAFSETFSELGFNIEALKNALADNTIRNQLLAIFTGFIGVGTISLLIGTIIYYYKVYGYYLTNYIISEDVKQNWKEVINKSKELMTKRKFYALMLDLSFVGWYLLAFFASSLLSTVAGPFSVILMMIGITMVSVYRDTSVTQMYLYIRGPKKETYNIIDSEEF